MAILVDYRCGECGSVTESFVETPAPSGRSCEGCGGTSRRIWSPVGLIAGASKVEKAPAAPKARKRQPLCATNPGVPGLCHMSESAGRSWIARYRGDGRAFDRELERQEQAATVSKPTMADAISHQHA